MNMIIVVMSQLFKMMLFEIILYFMVKNRFVIKQNEVNDKEIVIFDYKLYIK